MKLLIPTLALASSATAHTITPTCQNFLSGAFGASNDVSANTDTRAVAQSNSLADLVANLEIQMREPEMEDLTLENAPRRNRVVILLDSSGSMSGIKYETIEAFNNLLNQLKQTEAVLGEATQFSLVTFDDNANVMSSEEISSAVGLTSSNFNPNGGTALYDALGCTLSALENEEQNMLYLVTDGEENSSSLFTSEAVKTLVDQVLDEGLWEMAFIGSHESSEETAERLGINRFIEFGNGAEGIQSAMETVSDMITSDMTRRSNRRRQ